LSLDLIGFAGGNINRYRYVLNNPLRYVDPTGTSECDAQLRDCAQRAVKNDVECLKNVSIGYTICSMSCLLCMAAGPGFAGCFAICEAGCGYGGRAGITYCHVLEAGEVVSCYREYYECKKGCK
jgi:hypothetical protein